MKLMRDVLRFVWLMCLPAARKRWRHAKNYNMPWRMFTHMKGYKV